MKKLEHSYKKILEAFKKRRLIIEQKIERAKARGNTSWASEREKWLQELDIEAREISGRLAEAINPKERLTLKKEIAHFKKESRQLYESMKSAWRQWLEALIIVIPLAFLVRTYLFGLYHVPTGSAEPGIEVGARIWGNKAAYLFRPIKQGDLVIFDKPTFVYDRSNPLRYFWQRYVGFPLPFFGLETVSENWVKRVIAVPGDTIEGRIEQGKTVVYRNGKKLTEPYVNSYPLIRVKKTIGFFSEAFSPSFLKKQVLFRRYTYDPNKPLDQQPLYQLDQEEIVRDAQTGAPMLDYAGTPNYDYVGRSSDTFGPFVIPENKYWVMGDSRKNSEDSRYWGFLDGSLIHGRASFVLFSIDSEESFWLFALIKHPIDFWSRSVRWHRFFKLLY